MSATVVVVGGGLAGLTTALELADAGVGVTLLESRSRLGGVASSFRRDGMEVDTGQHVFLRCCTSYRRLLDRLGATGLTTLQDRLDLALVRPADGQTARLCRDRLPVLAGLPLHLGRGLATYPLLSLPERTQAVRAALALRQVDPALDSTDERSFGAWLAEHGQTPRAVEALWDLIGVATLNARAEDASLALAATVFQLGLLTDAAAADVGWSTVPLGRLHDGAARAALTAAGVELRTRTRVERLESLDGGWSVLTDDGPVRTDAVVVATEPAAAAKILPTGALSLAAGWAQQLGATPIVNLHVVLDRSVMTEPVLACVGSPLQWLFDRTEASGIAERQPGIQYLAASISAADDVSSLSVAELRARLLPELHRALPAAQSAEVVDLFVTREPHATFRQAPGSNRYRPGPATRLPGLAVAGAYTATGWPATMESAVRSGEAAARVVLETLPVGGTDRRRVGTPVVAA